MIQLHCDGVLLLVYCCCCYGSCYGVILEPSGIVHPVIDELADELTNSSLHHHAAVITTASHVMSSSMLMSSSLSLTIPSSLPSNSSHHLQATSQPLIVSTPVTSPVREKEKNSSSVVKASPALITNHTSKVITVATDAINRTKEITLPTNSVKIFASTWPELSKGMYRIM